MKRNNTRTRMQHPEAPAGAKICSRCGNVTETRDYYCAPCRAGYMRSYRLGPESVSCEANLLHDEGLTGAVASLEGRAA